MRKAGQVHVVGLSGPDGAGKSTALALLRRSLPGDGASSVFVYLYGCFLCRRMPPRLPESGDGEQSPLARFLVETHGLVDAVELWMRLSLAKARARLLAAKGTGRSIVVSDRSPLDGLAKHDPKAGSLAARAYARLAASYDVIAWLDAAPDVLAVRDREHAASELERQREAFARWAPLLANVARIDASAPPDVVASTIGQLARPLSTTQ